MKRTILLLLTVMAAVFSGNLLAQTFPSRPIKLLVGYPAGGNVDVVARLVGDELGKRLGQPIVVENRTGAGGQIGATAIARADPDGYTLMLAASPELSIAPLTMKSLPYNVQRDIQPVSLTTEVPFVLVVHPLVPANTVGELIDLAKLSPGKYSFASYGNATSNHLFGEMFNARAGTKILHVPYRGSAPAIADVTGGLISMTFDSIGVTQGLIKAGKLKALAVAMKQRSPLLPEVPTFAEAGLAGLEGGTWNGLVAPAKVPADIIARISKEVANVMRDPGTRAKLEARGLVPLGKSHSPEEFRTFVASELSRWTTVVNTVGIKAD